MSITRLNSPMRTYSATGSKSLASGAMVTAASLSLDPGTYIVHANARFDANSTGYRFLCIDPTSGNSVDSNWLKYCGVQVPATSGARTFIGTMVISASSTSRTMNAKVQQGSGSTLNSEVYIEAVRLM